MVDLQTYIYFVSTLISMFLIVYILYLRNEKKNRLRRRIQGAIPLLQIREKTDDLFSKKSRYESLLQRKLDDLLYKQTSVGNPINLKLYRCGLKKTPPEQVLLAFLIFFFIVFLLVSTLFSMHLFYSLLLSFGASIFLFMTILSYLENKRKGLIESQLSPAIEIIVRGIRSGSSIDKTFSTVVKEIPSPLKDEFYDILKGVEFGISYEKLMHVAAARIDIPEFYFFTTALIIQRESGGSLADVLDNIVTAINKSQELQMKIKSLSSEGQTTGYVLGGLPLLILFTLWFVRPDHVSFLLHNESGRVLSYIAAGLLSAGLFTIKRMTKIDI